MCSKVELATGEVLDTSYDQELYASPALFALELAEEKLLTENEQRSVEEAIWNGLQVTESLAYCLSFESVSLHKVKAANAVPTFGRVGRRSVSPSPSPPPFRSVTKVYPRNVDSSHRDTFVNRYLGRADRVM